MKGIFSFLKIAFRTDKRLFFISLLIVAALITVGCTTGQAGTQAPSGPIGGGCG